MFELRLMAPEDRVEMLSDALDALDALSVSVEDADAQTDAEQALFGEPDMPPPKEGWQRSRVIALFPDEALANEAASVLVLQDFFEGCTRRGRSARAGLGAAHAIAIRAGRDHARVLDRAELARAAGAGAHRDPARPGAGLRDRHPSDHPHVPALDRGAGRVRR
jgi:hypothetical protein